METVKASVFKATCLRLMEKVQRTGEQIIITKNGKPVSRLVPYREVPKTIFGLHRDKISSRDDLVSPVEVTWDVES
ncbi:MAG: type II toxin-antitoxin system Phd/YefM family antitoxin [Pontiellaceae bacterium]|nr:type II toxin-antitoxin system Phd/YefM family antitoxin [Candidatus Anaeroferrophillacea bacterium]MBN2785793.1 type II toxin-antitoxin system Phd/YefM family antitoxin [Pontiellaceae bacterium]